LGVTHLRGYGVAAAGVALVTVAIGWLSTGPPRPSLSMLYLLAVLGTATSFGRGPAIAAALLAVLAFNYFFVEPIHTFAVSGSEEWFSLVLLLVTAVVTGSLAAELRRRAEEAQRREREAVLLHELTDLVYADDRPEQALPSVTERLRRELGAARVQVHVAENVDLPPDATHLGPSSGVAVVEEPLRVGDHHLGVLRVDLGERHRGLTREERRLLSAVAAQIALALERARLRADATQAEVLRRSDELKTALLSSVSHDLRTPLAAIKAAAGSVLADDGAWSGEEGRAAARKIEVEVDRLNRIVGNLLDASRIESGALHPRKELYPLADLVEGVVRRVGRGDEGHHYVLDVPPDLPPVPLDYVQIEQVVTNLIENARVHTPPGTRICVSARTEGGFVRVTVADDGPGILPAALPRVFDKFFRAARPRARGSGLGLTVAKGLVEAHGGRIWAESAPGQGAAFHFELPLAS
jgi:two-component system sensor histidine kinase KdpD